MESRLFELEQEFKIKEARLLEEVENLKLELEQYWILKVVYTAFNDAKQRLEFFFRNNCYYCEEISAFFIISFTCILIYSHIQTHRQIQVCYSIPISSPKKTMKNKSNKRKKSLKWADHCGYSLTRVKLFHWIWRNWIALFLVILFCFKFNLNVCSLFDSSIFSNIF